MTVVEMIKYLKPTTLAEIVADMEENQLTSGVEFIKNTCRTEGRCLIGKDEFEQLVVVAKSNL